MSIKCHDLIDEGELNLCELWKLVWSKRWVALLGGGFGAAAYCFYFLISDPVYQARAVVAPPSYADIVPVNVGRGVAGGLDLLTAPTIFESYLRVLQSECLRQAFFHSVYLPARGVEIMPLSSEEYVRFSKSLAVVPLVDGGGTAVIFDDSVPEQALRVVGRFIEMAGVHAGNELTRLLVSDASAVAGDLERGISAARTRARALREDEILRLHDALAIATALGLDSSHLAGGLVLGRTLQVASESEPYLRGVQALEAEIDVLERRVSDDPFIEGLRQQQSEMFFYRNLKIELSADSIYQQHERADVSQKSWMAGGIVLFISIKVGMIISILFTLIPRKANLA